MSPPHYGPSQKTAPRTALAVIGRLKRALDGPMPPGTWRQITYQYVETIREQLSDFMEDDSRVNQDCLAHVLDSAGSFLEQTDGMFLNSGY